MNCIFERIANQGTTTVRRSTSRNRDAPVRASYLVGDPLSGVLEAMATKEEIYDEHFSPLVAQLIKLAKEHDIPMFATFEITDGRPATDADGDNPGFFCTTSILPSDTHESLQKLHGIMRPAPPRVFAFTIMSTPKPTE